MKPKKKMIHSLQSFNFLKIFACWLQTKLQLFSHSKINSSFICRYIYIYLYINQPIFIILIIIGKHMSNFYKLTELEKLGIITIYRMLLKNLKDYPSINRYNIMMAVQDEFRENIKVSPSQIPKLRKKAQMGLRHVLYYIQKNEQLKQNRYHNLDEIQPFAKKKQENIYF